jgi:hypothetical protein
MSNAALTHRDAQVATPAEPVGHAWWVLGITSIDSDTPFDGQLHGYLQCRQRCPNTGSDVNDWSPCLDGR